MESQEYEIFQSTVSDLPMKVQGFTEIRAGFSSDKKYRLSTREANLLLRISDISQSKNRETEFGIIETAFGLGVKCNRPIRFARLTELGICYSCFEFIEGEDAEVKLSQLTETESNQIGSAAGKDLKKLNGIKPLVSVVPWRERKIRKHEMFVREYHQSGYSFEGDSEILEFIQSETPLMLSTVDTFQHDDFHVGNIIIHNRQYNGVIDFNRMDWGDYVHDFVKLGWFSRMTSIPFANGQIAGYFDHGIPLDFWKKYSLYMAMSIYSTVVWHLKNFPHLIDQTQKHIDAILSDHDRFKRQKPKWVD